MHNSPISVQLIGKANGVGLSRDIDLLTQALEHCGCRVSVHPVTRADSRRRRSILARWWAHARYLAGPHRHLAGARHDLNIMLEHVWPQFLHQGRCNVLVPNPEWFDRRDLRFLRYVDRVWAKTRHAQQLFEDRGRNTTLIGFDSEDRHDPGVARLPQFLHLAGKSPLKGTERLLALWQRHRDWPRLIVVQDPDMALSVPSAANIDYRCSRVADAELRTLQNSCQFHLCLSEAEGWGHYMVEAMSVGAVIFCADAPPMNELLTSERAVLVAAPPGRPFNLSRIFQFESQALEAAIEQVLTWSPERIDMSGAAARRWYLANQGGFHARIQQALERLPVIA